jgi:signal transduction histidine kinase
VTVYAVDRDLRITYTNAPDPASPRTHLGSKGRPVVFGSYFPDLLNEPDRTRFVTRARAVLQGDVSSTGVPSHVDISFPGTGRKLRLLIGPLPGSGQTGGLVVTCVETGSDQETAHVHHAHEQAHEAVRLDLARQLAATLNHEINNPLFIVSATLEDLLAEAVDPDEQRRLRAALDAVWRVASAVKQLQEIRQIVTTPYVEGLEMIDLEASQEPVKARKYGEDTGGSTSSDQ